MVRKGSSVRVRWRASVICMLVQSETIDRSNRVKPRTIYDYGHVMHDLSQQLDPRLAAAARPHAAWTGTARPRFTRRAACAATHATAGCSSPTARVASSVTCATNGRGCCDPTPSSRSRTRKLHPAVLLLQRARRGVSDLQHPDRRRHQLARRGARDRARARARRPARARRAADGDRESHRRRPRRARPAGGRAAVMGRLATCVRRRSSRRPPCCSPRTGPGRRPRRSRSR